MKRRIIGLLLFFYSSWVWAEENYLRETKLVGDELHLQFKFDLKGVDHFIIPSQGFTKYVYDIKEGVLPVGKTLPYSHPNVTVFRIGQYTKDILRIVIESQSGKGTAQKIEGKTLIIPLPTGERLSTSKKQTKKIAKRIKPNGLRVVIDPGHGGIDNGASFEELKEKAITLTLAQKLRQKLQGEGYTVRMTRKKDKYVSLINRTEYANAQKADIFISIHANAAPPKKRKRLNGIEIFYLTLNNSKSIKKNKILHKGKTIYGKSTYRFLTNNKKIDRSKKLAKNVQQQIGQCIHRGYKNINSDLKCSDFWVLLGTKMPAILVEVGYLTHEKDRKRLKSSYYQNLLIEGMVNGINNYFHGK